MENIGIEAETWEILFVQLDYVTFSSRFSLLKYFKSWNFYERSSIEMSDNELNSLNEPP